MPGCREVVTDGENGLLVPARDVPALAAALRALLEDSALRQRMGECGRRRAEAAFGVEQVTAQTLAIYRELLTV
jgi:glycosyltransferase involved in cell wall biosynthesis